MALQLTLNINHPGDAEQAAEMMRLLKEQWHWKAPEANATEKPLTREDARAALELVVDKLGMSDGLDILKSYGAAKVSDLSQDHYADFVSICQEAAA